MKRYGGESCDKVVVSYESVSVEGVWVWVR